MLVNIKLIVHFHDHGVKDPTKTAEQTERMDHRNIISIKINLMGFLDLIISWAGWSLRQRRHKSFYSEQYRIWIIWGHIHLVQIWIYQKLMQRTQMENPVWWNPSKFLSIYVKVHSGRFSIFSRTESTENVTDTFQMDAFRSGSDWLNF